MSAVSSQHKTSGGSATSEKKHGGSVGTALKLYAAPKQGGGWTEGQKSAIRFWLPQMKEHAFFMHAMIVPVDSIITSPLLVGGLAAKNPLSVVPSVATQVPASAQWEVAVKYSKLLASMKAKAKDLMGLFAKLEVAAFEGILADVLLDDALDRLAFLKKRTILLQRAGVATGFAFPHFVEHILKELEYFRWSVHGMPVGSEQERDQFIRAFWTEINADHAAFAAHLLNPNKKTRQYVMQALQLADEGQDAWTVKLPRIDPSAEPAEGETAMEIMEAVRISSRLFDAQDFVKRVNALKTTVWNNGKGLPDVKSIIHPLLLAHVVREGQRAEEELKSLKTVETIPTGGTADAYTELGKYIAQQHPAHQPAFEYSGAIPEWPSAAYQQLYPTSSSSSSASQVLVKVPTGYFLG